MQRILFAFGVVVVATFATLPPGEDWPRFRGPGRAGQARGLTAPPTAFGPDKNILWKVPLPGGGTSSPVLFGDRIFLTCYTGYNVPGQGGGDQQDLKRHVLCLDRATGRQICDNTGNVYCANAKTGDILYEERLPRAGQVYASPVLAGGNIYYLTRDGYFFVVAAKPEFELVASNEQIEERGIFDATPAVADGKLYVRSHRFLYCIGAK